MSYAYRLATLKVFSDIELPELLPWSGECRALDTIFFRVGELPVGFGNADRAAANPQATGDSRYLLSLGDRAKVLVENGHQVTIEPTPGADPTDIRAVLMGPAQAILWHQRGLLPLHASAVILNGKAVALAGRSGAGKSSLAAALSRKNHAVLADDICIIDTSVGVRVLPSTPRLRLWREALDHFGIQSVGLPRALSRSEKYLIEGHWAGVEAQQLGAVILLSRGACQELTVRRLRGWRSFTAVQDVIHMFDAAHLLGLDAAIFSSLEKLFDAGVAVWELSVPDDLVCLEQAAQEVLSTIDMSG